MTRQAVALVFLILAIAMARILASHQSLEVSVAEAVGFITVVLLGAHYLDDLVKKLFGK